MEFMREEEKDIKEVFYRFKRKNFSGNTGQAIKNSSYQLSTTLISKIGSLLFIIILAGELITVKLFGLKSQILSPELFGLYSLSLATIVLFGSFSDLGIGTALVTFISKALGKNNLKKAKSYAKWLLKYKIYLAIFSSISLMILSYFIANFYYNKPIFYALLFGGVYILITGISGYLDNLFISNNNFKILMRKEIIFQSLRITLVPSLAFYLLATNSNPPLVIAAIILSLSFCYFVSFIFLLFNLKKISFLNEKSKKLHLEEKNRIKKFVIPLSFTALSGMFFGYIDTLMLGRYVPSEFIGYYGAAFGLIGAGSTILGFIPSAILPVFSRLKKDNLEKIFKKSRKIVLIISFIGAIFTFIFAKYLLLIYGDEYLPATILLQTFSILLVLIPLIGIYSMYLTSKEKTGIIAKVLIFSTIVNIILNFFFIRYGLNFGMIYAVLGAALATVISRLVYLAGLVWNK